jgi:hypothetical protein
MKDPGREPGEAARRSVLKLRPVTAILGHADPAMTLERYTPVLPD